MKKMKKIKRIGVILLIFLLNINSFAAIVSDNDGSAFVTKAEFDALKKSFNKQIDDYNRSIDAKIDGAISQYLSGINLYKKYNIEPEVTNYKDIRWVNDWYTKVSRRKFTSQTTYTDLAATYEKPLWPDRRTLRCSRLYMRWGLADDVTYQMFMLQCGGYENVARKYNDYWYGDHEGGGSTNPIPTKYLTLYKENDVWIYNRGGNVKIRQEYKANDTAYGTIFETQHGGTGQHIVWHGFAAGFGEFKESTTASDEILRFSMKLYMGDKSGTTWELTDKLTSKNIPIVYPNSTYDFDDGSGGRQLAHYTTNLCYEAGKDENNNIFETRAKAQAIKDNEVLTNMMLGADCSTEFNVGYCKEDILMGSSREGWDWSSSVFVPTDMGNKIAITTGVPGASSIGDSSPSTYLGGSDSNHLTLNLPLWPKLKLGELRTGQFKRSNGDYLQLNQGLPLGKMPLKGNMIMKLQYHGVNNDLDTSSTVPGTQEVKFSVKKNDFTTNNDADYLIDDHGNKVKDVIYNVPATDSIKLTMPIKDGDELWLRIGPKDTAASGQYIVIDKIEMQVQTEE